MNYLGLDFGTKHLGVAFSDGTLATPLTTLSTPRALTLLPAIITGHNTAEIVIGLPEGPSHRSAAAFITSLKFLGLPIHIVDETLSSADARLKLRHTTKSRRKVREHSAAAAVILQSWLDSRD